MTRGRRPHRDPPIIWRISLPQSLSDELEVLLTNPLTGEVAYGARSNLSKTLFRRWLAEHSGKDYEECPYCHSVMHQQPKEK